MTEAPSNNTKTDTQPNPVRLGYIALALILGTITFLVVPAESVNSEGEVIAGLSSTGRAILAIAIVMATLWISAALPMAVTALMPLLLFPLCTGGTISIKTTAAPYAHDLIFLFMGGFMMSLAMQQWGLHRRLALHVVLLIGTQPARLVAGLMLSCAFIT